MLPSYRPKLYDLCSFRYVVQEIKSDLMLCIGYDAGGGGGGGGGVGLNWQYFMQGRGRRIK